MAMDFSDIKNFRCKNILTAYDNKYKTVTKLAKVINEDSCEKLDRISFRCLRPDGAYSLVGMRFFFVTCSKINQQCSAQSGAFVAAATVCGQNLFV